MGMTESQQKQIISLARSLIGKPYKYGATPEEAPDVFDCSSFIQYIFKQIGVQIPRVSTFQAADPQGTEIIPSEDLSNLQPGDPIFTRGTIGRYNDELFGGER